MHRHLLWKHLSDTCNVTQLKAYVCSLVKLVIVECLFDTTACYAECCTTLTAQDYTHWAGNAEPQENACWSAVDKLDFFAQM